MSATLDQLNAIIRRQAKIRRDNRRRWISVAILILLAALIIATLIHYDLKRSSMAGVRSGMNVGSKMRRAMDADSCVYGENEPPFLCDRSRHRGAKAQSWRVPARSPALRPTPAALKPTNRRKTTMPTASRPAGSFFLAVRTEESRNGEVPVGDGGLSRGDYHITKAYWQDGCEQGGVDWDYEIFVWSNQHCEQAMVWYWQRYCPEALARLDCEILARVHNGGPEGHLKQSTIPYWDKIKSILEYAMSQRKAARTIPELAPDDIERFWSKVKFGNGGCWLWTAGVNGDGYGTFDLRTKSIRAHRISWALVNGPIGANLLVCHACDHPNCVNPKHLFTGTDADNHKDRNQKGRTARGERTGRAKLTSKQVIDIRKRYASGGITERALAAKYDVTQGNVHCVISRKSWTHI